jgi:hypothetical protein
MRMGIRLIANRLSPLFAAAVSLVLSGCFSSEQPKFPLASATAAFGEGGRYQVLERQSSGTFQHQEDFMVKRLADGSYEFVNEKGDVLPISFHPLADGVFVGQAKPEKEKPGYGYVVVRITAGEALLYAPQCDQQDQARLSAFKVILKDKYNCVIDQVADPRGLFAGLDFGEPISKLVRQ